MRMRMNILVCLLVGCLAQDCENNKDICGENGSCVNNLCLCDRYYYGVKCEKSMHHFK